MSDPMASIYETCLALQQEGQDTIAVIPDVSIALLQCVVGRLEAAQQAIQDHMSATATMAKQEHQILEAKAELTAQDLTSWLLILCGALVFFMQAGFAMLSAGSVRLENTQNTMLKNLLDACGAAVAFFCVGFAFSFGGDSSGSASGTTFVGTENFFFLGDIDLPFAFFQYTFSAASVTIVAGTLAERCRMGAYLCYSLFMTAFVYPVVAHAVWSSAGFLSAFNPDPLLGIGMVDFSGSGVVHLLGGTTALFATYVLGSRRGRFFDATTGELLDEPVPFPGHSVSLQVLGGFILWFGWFGFNPGSALLLSDNPQKAEIGALCAVNTFLASGGGCVSALIFKMLLSFKERNEYIFDIVAAMNGSLSGLVAITAGCATLEPWAALFVGFVAGILYLWGSHLLIKFRLDDAVDAIPVHMFNGLWGVLSVGLLSQPDRMLKAFGTDQHPGLLYSWGEGHSDASLLACQLIGILFVFGWSFVVMYPFFLLLNYCGWFRSKSLPELAGLDIAYHGVEATCGERLDQSHHSVAVDAYIRELKRSKEPKSLPEPTTPTEQEVSEDVMDT